jgi:hypothetical protein
MEKYQILQSVFGWFSLGFTILAAICGFYWNYYSGKIDDFRSDHQLASTEKTRMSVIEKIDSDSQKLLKEVHATKKPSVQNTQTTVNAPNAQIVTSGQSGGTNVVVTSADLNPAVIEAREWSIKNEVTSTLRQQYKGDIKYSGPPLYRNKILISYNCSIAKLRLALLIKRDDVIKFSLSKNPGFIQLQSGHNASNNPVISVQMPTNGTYSLEMYTRDSIESLQSILEFSE